MGAISARLVWHASMPSCLDGLGTGTAGQGPAPRACTRTIPAAPAIHATAAIPQERAVTANRMRIDQTFDLKDVAAAFNVSAAGHVVGKLAITVAASN
jgi:hypothetical protein